MIFLTTLIVLNSISMVAWAFNRDTLEPNQLKDSCILLSSPKSGNTWVRYFVQYLTEYNAGLVSEKPIYEKVLDPPSEMDPSKKKYFLIKSHEIAHPYDTIRSILQAENVKLILIVRSYKELIWRYSTHLHGSFDEKIYNNLIELICNDSWHYFNNLKSYDEWDDDKKLLVYYEDLMKQPQVEVLRIVDFLAKGNGEHSNPNLDVFWKDYEYHRTKSLETYNRFSESRSNGLDIFFYEKDVPKGFSKDLEKIVSENYPRLSQKYLARYFS